MKRNLKVLGIAAVAVLAMSVMASAAQAEGLFKWEAGTAKLTASANATQKFTTTAGSVECNEVSGEVNVSSLTSGQKSLTSANIVYKNSGSLKCPLEPFGNAEIKMNGCSYRFNAGETTGGNDNTLGTADVVCPEKKVIEVVAPLSACTIKIGPQNNLGPVTYESNTAATPDDAVINPAINNITYTHSGFACGSGGAATGTYNGSVTVKGETSGGAATAAWVD